MIGDSDALARLCEEQGVRHLRVFGSAARGQESPDSDLDLIVEFGRPAGFLKLVRLERLLSESFGRPVDLLTEPGLDPYIRDSVLSSASVRQGVLPAKPRESGEVRIGGVEGGLVVHGQGGQMGVGGEVAGRPQTPEKVEEG